MTADQQFFLNVISDHIQGRKTEPSEEINWERITEDARIHQMEGLVYAQCKELLCSNNQDRVLSQLKRAADASAYHYMKNLEALEELKRTFQANSICFFEVKGLEIASLYPVPASRTMGDLDLVMSTEERERIPSIMETLGYRLQRGYQHVYSRPSVELEVHDHLIYDENQETLQCREYFNSFWDYVEGELSGFCVLKREFHYLFLVEHLKQHFCAHGSGFRQFLDLALVSSSWTDMDWLWIEKELKKNGLWQFALTALAFCRRWWHAEFPIDVPDLPEEFYELSTAFVFSSGVFGLDNKNHYAYDLGNRMSVSSSLAIFRKVEAAVKRVCIPYEAAVKIPYCSFVKGRKYLLPVAWVYRIIYEAKHHKGKLTKILKSFLKSDEIIKKHRELLAQWGI